jgi:hypothetical protein
MFSNLRRATSFFVQNNFKVTEIALLFGCSKRTVEQRMQDYTIYPLVQAILIFLILILGKFLQHCAVAIQI